MVTSSLQALRGVADPTRRRIIDRLRAGGMAVREIAAGLPMSRPAVSKHLRVLKELGLVIETKVGRRRIYELVATPFEEMAAWMERVAEAEGARVVRPTLADAPSAPEGEGRLKRVRTVRAPGTEGEPGESDQWRSW